MKPQQPRKVTSIQNHEEDSFEDQGSNISGYRTVSLSKKIQKLKEAEELNSPSFDIKHQPRASSEVRGGLVELADVRPRFKEVKPRKQTVIREPSAPASANASQVGSRRYEPLAHDSRDVTARHFSPPSTRNRFQDELQYDSSRVNILSVPDEDAAIPQVRVEDSHERHDRQRETRKKSSRKKSGKKPTNPQSSREPSLSNENQLRKSKEIEPANNPLYSETTPSAVGANFLKNKRRLTVHEIKDIIQSMTPPKKLKMQPPKETLSEILKVKKDFVQQNLVDTPDYPEGEEQQKKMMMVLREILQPTNVKQRNLDQKLYGIKDEDWHHSTLNPFQKERLKQQDSDDSDENAKCEFLCFTSSKNDLGKRTCSFDIVIRQGNPFYLFFNFLISVLCIVSSYFYLYLASFRYPFEDEDPEPIFWIWLSFEIAFAIHMLLQFILEFKREDKHDTLKTVLDISVNYLQTQFVFDFIPLLPFQLIEEIPNKRVRLFFLIKMIRLVKGFSLFDVPKMMAVIKMMFQKNLLYIVENDEELANNREIDNNNIEAVLIISYFLKIFKLILVIANITYLIGMGWFLLCETLADFQQGVLLLDGTDEKMDEDTFISQFGIGTDHQTNLVLVMYFAFTSLSTVGFGDFHPRSNVERLVGAFILLFGVAIFSYIMGNFIDILQQFKKFHEDLEDGDNLTKFFGTLKKFNNSEHIRLDLKKKIENHFDYQWKMDKNMGFRDSGDIMIYDQLPEIVRCSIFKDFLFLDFLSSFKKQFTFPKRYNRFQPSFYTWEDQAYVNFMIDLLQSLEPRREEKYLILVHELDELNEVIFFQEGIIEAGFEINRMRTYVLRYKNKCAIGAYGVSFNQRSLLVFRTASVCTGYSIRKTNWKRVMDDHPEISTLMKEQIKQEYEHSVLSKVLQRKHETLKKWRQRQDYNGILQVVSKSYNSTESMQEKHGLKDRLSDLQEESVSQEGTPRSGSRDENMDFSAELEEIEDKQDGNRREVMQVCKQYDQLFQDHIDLCETHEELNLKFREYRQSTSQLKTDHQKALYEIEILRREISKMSPGHPLGSDPRFTQGADEPEVMGSIDLDFASEQPPKIPQVNSMAPPQQMKDS